MSFIQYLAVVKDNFLDITVYSLELEVHIINVTIFLPCKKGYEVTFQPDIDLDLLLFVDGPRTPPTISNLSCLLGTTCCYPSISLA